MFFFSLIEPNKQTPQHNQGHSVYGDKTLPNHAGINTRFKLQSGRQLASNQS